MFGKKRSTDRSNVIVAIITGLTGRECAKMQKHIANGKRRHARAGRGTCVISTVEGVAQALANGHKKLLGK